LQFSARRARYGLARGVSPCHSPHFYRVGLWFVDVVGTYFILGVPTCTCLLLRNGLLIILAPPTVAMNDVRSALSRWLNNWLKDRGEP
jgi:hypothetical protein